VKLGRPNHIGVATPSIADSIAFYRDVMGDACARSAAHYNDLVMCRS
jgi:hypothetical protein